MIRAVTSSGMSTKGRSTPRAHRDGEKLAEASCEIAVHVIYTRWIERRAPKSRFNVRAPNAKRVKRNERDDRAEDRAHAISGARKTCRPTRGRPTGRSLRSHRKDVRTRDDEDFFLLRAKDQELSFELDADDFGNRKARAVVREIERGARFFGKAERAVVVGFQLKRLQDQIELVARHGALYDPRLFARQAEIAPLQDLRGRFERLSRYVIIELSR